MKDVKDMTLDAHMPRRKENFTPNTKASDMGKSTSEGAKKDQPK